MEVPIKFSHEDERLLGDQVIARREDVDEYIAKIDAVIAPVMYSLTIILLV
jgi:hypothetical protein